MGIDKAAAIKAFQTIRDIPYAVDVEDENYGWQCTTKAEELQSILEELGYQTRLMMCHFDWRTAPFPENILALYDHDQETTHAYLEIRSSAQEKWRGIDPSWDKPLEKLGFEIAEWDGEGATRLAVKPTKRFNFEESQDYFERVARDVSGDIGYRRKNKAFFEAMNTWMNEVRT